MLDVEKKEYNRQYYEKHKERLRKKKYLKYKTDPNYRSRVTAAERRRYREERIEKLFMEGDNAEEK